jgi:subtilisin family serine protease
MNGAAGVKVLLAWIAIALPALVLTEGESLATTPNDPSFSVQWAASNVGQSIPTQSVEGGEPLGPPANGTPGADDRALAAWGISTGSRSIVIGELDTGVDYTHSDLAANIWSNPGGIGGCPKGTHGYNVLNETCDPTDEDAAYGGHGTHVAGIMGAVGNNTIGVAGMNWQTTILPVKWLQSGGLESEGLVKALEWIVKVKKEGVNVRVVNDSPTFVGTLASPAVKAQIEALGENNILFVTAAGNSGKNNDEESGRRYPCGYQLPNEICVTATDNNDALPKWANYGPKTVDLAAPGVSIYSTLRGGEYGYLTGGSMASAQVAGAAALILSAEPSLTPTQVKARILEKARPDPALVGKLITPRVLDVCKAMLGCEPTPPAATTLPATGLAQTGATLKGTVNPNGALVTNCHFEYGISMSYGSSAPCSPSPGSGTSAVPVSASIGGLTANTRYHFRLAATNAKGTNNGADLTLTTTANKPTVVTGGPSSVAQTEATLTGTVNPNGAEVSECHFNYGTSKTYGLHANCTPSPGSGTSPVAVSVSISGLAPNTTYHFQVVATNTTGTNNGADATFTTLPNVPAVTTGAASAVAQTTGTLNGSVNPNGGAVSDCHFEYGTSTSYGSIAPCASSPGSGTGSVPVSASISGLASNTTYHFRAVATNAGGGGSGVDQVLTTTRLEEPPAVQGALPFVQQLPAEVMRVRLARRSLTVSRSGTVAVGIGCTSSALACKGTLVLRTPPGLSSRAHGAIKYTSAAVTLAAGSFSVSPGAARVLNLRLTAAGRRLVARTRSIRAVLTLRLHRPDGSTETTAVRVVLRQARSSK